MPEQEDKKVYIRAVESHQSIGGKQERELVQLQSAYRKLSKNGELLLINTGLGQNGIINLFVTWRGKGSNFRGVAYIPNRKNIADLVTETNYDGDIVIRFSPFQIDGKYREISAIIKATETAEVFMLAYNLD